VSPNTQAQWSVSWDCQTYNATPYDSFSFTISYGDGSSEPYQCNVVCNRGSTGRAHAYSADGNYTVTVSADGDNGPSSTSTTVIVYSNGYRRATAASTM